MSAATLCEISLQRLRLPLATPYRLSYHTFEAFEPIVVMVRDEQGRSGFGEGHIAPGSSSETREGGWAFCRSQARRVVGMTAHEAMAAIIPHSGASPVAATALLTALEMLVGNTVLRVDETISLALLTAFNATTPATIADEVEQRLAQGFAAFKLKVGRRVETDLARVRAIQQAVAGRASLRIDANRGYSREDGCRFASELDPDGIELFEQPCAAGDWDANAAVARASAVPLMLDEPICSLADIERAATLDNVGFCKLKLKRFGGLERLSGALEQVRELGMEPVLGDGLASEIGCWMEACVARSTIRNSGEFNGFLKPRGRVFTTPLVCDNGSLILQPGTPTLDAQRLAESTVLSERFTA